MLKNAPFLKMYTEYVKNFDTAMTVINTQYAKNSKFAAIIDNIQVQSTLCLNYMSTNYFCLESHRVQKPVPPAPHAESNSKDPQI